MPTLSFDNILTLVQALVKYGPEAVQAIINLLKKSNPTVADVETLFAGLKPYSYYGIPDVVPTSPPVANVTIVPPPTT